MDNAHDMENLSLCMHECVCSCEFSNHVCMCVYARTYTSICICLWVRAFTCVHAFVWHSCASVCVCIRICVYVCVHVVLYNNLCVYVCVFLLCPDGCAQRLELLRSVASGEYWSDITVTSSFSTRARTHTCTQTHRNTSSIFTHTHLHFHMVELLIHTATMCPPCWYSPATVTVFCSLPSQLQPRLYGWLSHLRFDTLLLGHCEISISCSDKDI